MKIKAEFVVLVLAALAGIMLVFRNKRGEGLLEGAPYNVGLPFSGDGGMFGFSGANNSAAAAPAIAAGCFQVNTDGSTTAFPCAATQAPAQPVSCYQVNADGSRREIPCIGAATPSTSITPSTFTPSTIIPITPSTITPITPPGGTVNSSSGTMFSSTGVDYLPTQECTIKRARTTQMINAQGQMQEMITGYDEFRSNRPECQPCPMGQARVNGVCVGSASYDYNRAYGTGYQITGTFAGRDDPWTQIVEGPEDSCATAVDKAGCLAGLVNPGSSGTQFTYGGEISNVYQTGQTQTGQTEFEKNQAIQIAKNAIENSGTSRVSGLLNATYSRPNNSEEVWTIVHALTDGCRQTVTVRRVWRLTPTLEYTATGQAFTKQNTVWGPWAPSLTPRTCTTNNPIITTTTPTPKQPANPPGTRCGNVPANAWSNKAANGDCLSKIDVDEAENGTLKKFLDLATRDIDGDVMDTAVLAEIVMVRTPANKTTYHFFFISEQDAKVTATLARFNLNKPATVFNDKPAYNKWVVVHATVDNSNAAAPKVVGVATPQNDLGTPAAAKCPAGQTRVGTACTPARQIKPDPRCPAGKVQMRTGKCECPPGQKEVNGACAWTMSGSTPSRCIVSTEGKKYPYYRPRRGQPCVPCNPKNNCDAKKFAV